MLSDGRIMFPDASSYSGCRGVLSSSPFNSLWWHKQKQYRPYVYENVFGFTCKRKNTKREIWIQKDITRFHGDELLVSRLPSIGIVCVEDLIEFPIVIANAFGFLNLNSFRWKNAELLTENKNGFHSEGKVDLCALDKNTTAWYVLVCNDCYIPLVPIM